MGNPDQARLLLGELTQKVGGLFETFLGKPPPTNIVDLWKEHQRIRAVLTEINEIQKQLDTQKTANGERSPELLATFLSWADQIGIQRKGVEVVENADVGGYGLQAKNPISKGSVVVSVPRHAMLSLDLAKKSSMMKKAFEIDPIIQRMENVALTMFLCCHKLKTDSKWKAYIGMLPKEFSSPLYFDEDDMLKLKPSPVFEEAMLFYRTVARQFTLFFLAIARNEAFDKTRKTSKNSAPLEPPVFYNTPFTIANFTFDLYRWAVACVTTRINMIPSETEKIEDGTVKLIPALIPLLDMANHEFINGAVDEAVAFNTEDDTAEIVAARDYAASKPVNIFYGRRSNAEHLLHNGFVPEGQNPSDRYKLKIGLPRTDKHFQKKHKLIFDLGFAGWFESNVFMFDLANDPVPFHPTLETFACIYVSDPPTDEIIKSRATLLAAVRFLKVRFGLLESTYGKPTPAQTSIERNIERLKQGEISILRRAKTYCEKWEEQILLEPK